MSRKVSKSQEITVVQIPKDDSYIEPDPPNPEMVAYELQRSRRQKIILAVSSVVLFATMVLIGFSGVLGNDRSTDYSAGHEDAILDSHINAFCQLTDFEDVCVASIKRYAVGQSESEMTPKTFTLYSLRAAINDVGIAYNYSQELVNGGGLDGTLRRAFVDCEEHLLSALQDLQLSYEDTDSMTMDGSPYQLLEILTALSASTAYEQTCADGLASQVGEEVKSMTDILTNATKQTRNNLAIAAGTPGTAYATQVGTPPPARLPTPSQLPEVPRPGGRRWLLDEEEEEDQIWFPAKGKPDVVVAQDGTGNFKTITEALDSVPKVRDDRFEIYVKRGIYEEVITVTDEMKYVTMYGDGTKLTIVAGNKSASEGLSTHATATAIVLGKAFMARNMSFENTAGPTKGPAVALRVESDLSVFYNCRIDGYHSTLMTYTHRQFYRNCVISGVDDIIHGDAVAIFQSCQILVKESPRARENILVLQSRLDRHEITGTVIQNCTITTTPGNTKANVIPTYLGRPVKERSRIVVMQSFLDDLIEREGWALPLLDNKTIVQSSFLAEFGNYGPSADVTGRVKWPAFHVLKEAEVAEFTVKEFIQGSWWLNMTGTPFYAGILEG
ncbi:putative pectinesterase/pectinesterase inhibitor 28 [Aristolochia californica]|uniref:putative pectinesterase/pectinesterase inhibitor 28 n=1 Tax=Aristolochia californica TaxID=171875 RepID=UPI0035D9A1F0